MENDQEKPQTPPESTEKPPQEDTPTIEPQPDSEKKQTEQTVEASNTAEPEVESTDKIDTAQEQPSTEKPETTDAGNDTKGGPQTETEKLANTDISAAEPTPVVEAETEKTEGAPDAAEDVPQDTETATPAAADPPIAGEESQESGPGKTAEVGVGVEEDAEVENVTPGTDRTEEAKVEGLEGADKVAEADIGQDGVEEADGALAAAKDAEDGEKPADGEVQPAANGANGENGIVQDVGEVEKTGEENEILAPLPSDVVTADTNATATVKFVLVSTGQVATMRWSLNQTLTELKEHFSRELKIPAHVIMLMFDGKDVSNSNTLSDLGVGPNGTVQLEMQSADPVNTPIRGFRPRQEHSMPDVITVRVHTDGGGFKDVVVEIERIRRRKPYIGGYRHKVTGAEYHHAAAQTMGPQKPPSTVPRFCRDSQTVEMRHRRQQTTQDTSTQMTKIGVYVANTEDKIMGVGKYTTAEQHHRMVLRNIIILQKHWRRWLAQKAVAKLRKDRNDRLAWEREEEVKKRKEKDERIRQEFQRRMNPKTKEDFDLLFSALEKWRIEELDKINSSLSGAERKAALCQLLEQETQLIASIGLHKQVADEHNKKLFIQNFLEKAASPKSWKGPDGNYTQMDTAFTVRARELKDIYNSITMKYLTQDERLDVLLTLKHTVKEHDCKLTQEIIELIDREANLLMRGTKDSTLEGLRKRIATLFLQYVKTPTFNPEAAKLLKVPQDPAALRQDIYFCPGCGRYLSSTDFQLATNSKAVGRCRKCKQMDNNARTREDFRHYRLMLRDLRQTEESVGDGSKVAFLLQESDLRYLVEKIWGSQSVLSACDSLYDIVLVRWHKFEEWSPWNCVCLTKEESTAHEKLESLSEGYGDELVQKVNRKHTLARSYFSRLPGMAEHMRKKTEEIADSVMTGIKATPISTVRAQM